MKKLVLLLVLAGAAYGGWRLFERYRHGESERVARERVEVMLRERARNAQTSLAMWAEGRFLSDYDSMAKHVDAYESFWVQAGLDPPGRWEVQEVEVISGGSAVVTLTDGNQTLDLVVVPKQRIRLNE